MGLLPPPGLGSSTMSTSCQALGQTPWASQEFSRSASCCSAVSGSEAYALGGTLSAPSPVPVGKDSEAVRSMRGVIGGALLCIRPCGGEKALACSSHSAAHLSASSSTSPCCPSSVGPLSCSWLRHCCVAGVLVPGVSQRLASICSGSELWAGGAQPFGVRKYRYAALPARLPLRGRWSAPCSSFSLK